MLKFLKHSRKYLNAKEPTCIVLGNESCDLDSAVSSISLAYFNHKNRSEHKTDVECNFLPILNIPKRDFSLKTEVRYFLNKYSITEEMLTFRDELTEEFLQSSQLVLVDHHVSPWLNNSIAIYDHRPRDSSALIPEQCEVHMDLVGSCATLIADLYITKEILGEDEHDVLNLLRGTIVLDTVNFSQEAARATTRDHEACAHLENALGITNAAGREELFNELVKARSDVNSLTAAQLLRKDNKILTSTKLEDMKLAIPGFPIPVQEFISKDNAERDIREFATENNCSVILLMGMFVKLDDNSVHRDIGLINISNDRICNIVKQKLESLTEPNLNLNLYNDCKFMNGSFYMQGNIKATRKHILPHVKNVLEN
ncbi:exopolyphosphatase prune [Haematobia irritans]|uniref:exopolyphosphatase prune n=1 Tax=Haematobia irritans TaxID=7368 RepID=UPI003F504C5B